MREAIKRLTCVNRDDLNKNVDALEKIIDRHIKKMKAKGWKLAYIRAGSSCLYTDAYVHMTKG